MKELESEFRRLRRQMEEDFLIHAERVNAQKQSLQKMEESSLRMELALQEVQTHGEGLHKTVTRLQKAVEELHQAVDGNNTALAGLSRELTRTRHDFRQFTRDSMAKEETWTDYRKRNERVMDIVQAALFMGEIETETRFEKLEKRVILLEERLDGAA